MLKKLLLTVMLMVPLMLVATTSEAGCKHYRYGYYGCHYGPKNMSLVYSVVRKLRSDPATADQPIYVSARGHKVMLSGTVGTPMQRQTAVNIARYTCGVRLVVDNLYLQSP